MGQYDDPRDDDRKEEARDEKPRQERDAWGRPVNKSQEEKEFEEAMKKFKEMFGGLFGKTKRGGGNSGNEEGPVTTKIGGGWLVLPIVLLIIWALSGIFIVSPPERSVIVRFGKYVRTLGPGPHWIPRFFERNYTLNVQRVSNFSYSAEMLTKDENIVSVALAVQYRIDDARNFLFNVVSPIESLKQATASALRQVVGRTTLDDILTTGRQKAREDIATQINTTIAMYQPGLLVTEVTLQPAKPPEQVTAAFDDAIKAREDEQRYINKARAYANQKILQAKGQASRIEQEANGYRQQVVLHSQADTAVFLQLLPQYKLAPKVTRERLYLETMESVLKRTSKVLVDVKGGNNLIYLPLDKIFQRSRLPNAVNAMANKLQLDPPVVTSSSHLPPRPMQRSSYELNGVNR